MCGICDMYHAIAGLAESEHAKDHDGDDDGGCFAAAGTAEVRGRGPVALGELRVGDEVRTGKEQVRRQEGQGREERARETEVGGGGQYGRVYFSHAHKQPVRTVEVALRGEADDLCSLLASSRSLRLTASHYLPVRP